VVKITGDSIIFKETLQDKLASHLRVKLRRRFQRRPCNPANGGLQRRIICKKDNRRASTRRGEKRNAKAIAGVFIPLLLLVLIAAAAETQSTGTETVKHAVLQKVDVVRGDDSVSLEITVVAN